MTNLTMPCKPLSADLSVHERIDVGGTHISNNRILKLEDDQVTFRYQNSETGQTKYGTLPALEFIRRFLQHVLPKGFVKVRYYGFFSPSQRPQLQQIRQLLIGSDTPPLSHPQLPNPVSQEGPRGANS